MYQDKRPPGEHPREQRAEMRTLLKGLYTEFTAYLAARLIEDLHVDSEEEEVMGCSDLHDLHKAICDRTRQILYDEPIRSHPGDIDYVVGVLTSGPASNEKPAAGAVHQESISAGNATGTK